MMRYRISDARLRGLIEESMPGWLQRARQRTSDLVAHGSYTKEKLSGRSAPSWSDVKAVWQELQGYTCAYCQKHLAVEHGAVESDVEHYRPKAKTTGWTAPASVTSNVDGRGAGYHWLAYNHWNYCVSCKTCNSTLKSTRFPIAGAASAGPPGFASTDMRRVVKRLQRAEEPLIPFPIGAVDVDPETLIAWEGIVAVPKAEAGTPAHQRGVATISFFNLNGRSDLLRERAGLVERLWRWHQAGLHAKNERLLRNRQQSMRACGRAYLVRLGSDLEMARQFARDAERMLLF